MFVFTGRLNSETISIAGFSLKNTYGYSEALYDSNCLLISYDNTNSALSGILDISIYLGEEIINRNWASYIFITDEDCLSLGDTKENMNILLKLTFFREDDDWTPLGEREVKILDEEYNIRIV